MDKVKEEILTDAKNKMVAKAIDFVGRVKAERFAGFFFDSYVLDIEGKSVAEYIYDLVDNKARPK